MNVQAVLFWSLLNSSILMYLLLWGTYCMLLSCLTFLFFMVYPFLCAAFHLLMLQDVRCSCSAVSVLVCSFLTAAVPRRMLLLVFLFLFLFTASRQLLLRQYFWRCEAFRSCSFLTAADARCLTVLAMSYFFFPECRFLATTIETGLRFRVAVSVLTVTTAISPVPSA